MRALLFVAGVIACVPAAIVPDLPWYLVLGSAITGVSLVVLAAVSP